MRSILNPNAMVFVPRTPRPHHSGKRTGDSMVSRDTGPPVSKHQGRQEGRGSRGWPGQLHPVNRNKGMHRAIDILRIAEKKNQSSIFSDPLKKKAYIFV